MFTVCPKEIQEKGEIKKNQFKYTNIYIALASK